MVTTTWSWAETWGLWWARRGTSKTVRHCHSSLENSLLCAWRHRGEWVKLSSSTDSDNLIVQVVGQRSNDNVTKFLMVQSLHRDNLHRHGNISVYVALLRRQILTVRATRHYRNLRVSCSRSLFPQDSTPGTSYSIPCSCSLKSLGDFHHWKGHHHWPQIFSPIPVERLIE